MSGNLDDVADALYGLAPEAFTAARNERARELVARGEKQAAAEVRKLTKPSRAAWFANQLVRRHTDEVDELLGLRQDLVRAQRSGARDELRAVTLRRRRIVSDLVAAARGEAAEGGVAMSAAVQGELETTLEAAVATEKAGVALRGGRLVEALTHVGFGDLGPPPPAREPRSGTGPPAPAGSPARRRGGAAVAQGGETRAERKPAGGADKTGAAQADKADAARAKVTEAAMAALADAESAVAAARRHRQDVVERRRSAAEELRRAERALVQASTAMERAQDRRRRAAQALREAESGRPR
ncbi:MAG: hypothetical protein ABSG81_05245 [Acidimicrobiales bacterium]